MRKPSEGAAVEVQNGRMHGGLAWRGGGGDNEGEGETDPGCAEGEDLAGWVFWHWEVRGRQEQA